MSSLSDNPPAATAEIEGWSPRTAWFLLAVSLLLAGAGFWLEGHLGLSLADEGWLWYGTVATAHGQTPILDFNSYEPARYWWGAAWSFLFGDSLLALRGSIAVFEALGIFWGLLALSRAIRSKVVLTLIGVLLAGWMLPRHKVFDPAASMAGVLCAVWWLEKPGGLRTAVAGVVVGIAALVGRNHGLYNGLGFLGLIVLVHFKASPRPSLVRELARFGGGALVGWAPLGIMLLINHQLAIEYGRDLLSDFRFARNPLPVTWPWMIGHLSFKPSDINAVFSAFAPIVMPAFYLGAIIALMRSPLETIRRWRVVAGGSFIGVFYLHHAFYRADFIHLAQATAPFTIATLAVPALLPPGGPRRWLIGCLAVVSVFSFIQTAPSHPLYLMSTSRTPYQPVEIEGQKFMVTAARAEELREITGLVGKMVKPGEKLLIVPHSPGLYMILGRESPIREVYLYMEVLPERQQQAIEGIIDQRVEWVLISARPFDGRKERSMESTHELLWRYVWENYCPPAGVTMPAGRELLVRCKPWPSADKEAGR